MKNEDFILSILGAFASMCIIIPKEQEETRSKPEVEDQANMPKDWKPIKVIKIKDDNNRRNRIDRKIG